MKKHRFKKHIKSHKPAPILEEASKSLLSHFRKLITENEEPNPLIPIQAKVSGRVETAKVTLQKLKSRLERGCHLLVEEMKRRSNKI